ncbi:tetratricopeptide repeat protein [Helicobacter acinonychis]|uniref:tetratricopeptide repeat protein n=1 Tax=Helicobacter acinonychis TaxID=212 RepID=UPI000CF0D749|nr:tetratricopeptide repeat protein [Helicobacter acinonychis]STP05050.1 tetratricopeptide repeat family protein [Helicobacter acinonychis]
MLNEEQNPQKLEELEQKGSENKAEKETPLKGIHSKIPSFKQALEQTLNKIKNSKNFFKQLLHNKKRLYITLGVLVLLIALIAALSLLIGHKKESQPTSLQANTPNAASETPNKTNTTTEAEGQIENLDLPDLIGKDSLKRSDENQVDAMIQKASILYEQGQKDEALHLFDKIASFSQGIASHNLGVIKFKEKDFNGALDLFDSSIASKENASVSAIDALVSAYYLQDADLYYHYLKIARDTLYKDYKKSFYSYAYALKSYYAEEYFEALSPLMHPNSNAFLKPNARLASKLFLMFKDEANAYKQLQKSADIQDELSLGLLQARLGNYKQALQHLQHYLHNYPKDLNALMALELVGLKMGDTLKASEALKLASHTKEDSVLANSFYPIKPTINPVFLDKEKAKERFWNTQYFEGKRDFIYRLLFYYAPFKVLDSKETLGVIEEGLFLLDSDTQKDLEGASLAFKRGRLMAIADKNALKGLKELEKKRLKKALGFFNLSLKNSPNNALLHYNAGLIYAQLEDYYKAYFHFLRAFHLNSADYLSAIFAILASHFTHEDTTEFLREITESFYSQDFSSPTQKALLSSLIAYLNYRTNWDMDWLKNAPKKLPFYYALEAVFAKESKDKKLMVQSFGNLKKMLPNDLISNIFYEIVSYYDASIRHTLSIYTLLDSHKISWDQTMLGPILGRNFYAYMGFMVNDLDKQEKLLEQKIASLEESEAPNDWLDNLALVSLFQGKYEKASALYQNLIDGLKDNEARLKILASLAYIAQNNYDSAALWLELGKLDEPNNENIRYALGLLYQRKGDLKSALNHFLAIKTSDFFSPYFDFEIDTNLLKERLNQEKKGEFLE